MTSKITSFFAKAVKEKNYIDTERVNTDKKEKRKCLSASSTDSDFSPTARQEKKRTVYDLFFEADSEDMDIRDILQTIENKLSQMATTDDIKKLGLQFSEKIDQLEGRLFEMFQKTDAMQKEITSLKADNLSLREKLLSLENSQNDLEQYDRRLNIRVFNVQERQNESSEDCVKQCCRIFTDLVGVSTKESDVEVAHRVGRVEDGKRRPRPIIVRFNNRKQRDRILADKKKLKGKGVSVAEDLTTANYRLERTAFRHSAALATWASNGKIFVKVKNGKVLRLRVGEDVDATLNKAMK